MSRFSVSLIGLSVLLITLLVGGAAAKQQGPDQFNVTYRGQPRVVHADLSPRLDEISPAAWTLSTDIEMRDDFFAEGLQYPDAIREPDGALQSEAGAGVIPAPLVTFNGPSNLSGVTPPDPNSDVGLNHVVAISNLSFAVYNKAGARLYPPSPGTAAPNNTLWSGFGGACEQRNDGDPIVLYDQLADRWLISQFTASGPTYYECVALSTSSDPTGSYYRWAIDTGSNFPDYPKVGMWPDGYYFSTREFSGNVFMGIGAYSMNKAQMLVGNPNPTIISFFVSPGGAPYNVGDGLLPADLDGSTLPPEGSPHYFVGSMDDGGPYGAPQDALTLWHFKPDWTTPSSSEFRLAATLPAAGFDSMFPCIVETEVMTRKCIPQKNTLNMVDVLSYRQRPMFRLAYRNFGTHESLVTNQSVEARTGIAGIRWWEIRSPNGTPTIYQQGTFSPNDGVHRWMGSIAMDRLGNMALGYSASSTSMHPGIWYTGRLFNDPTGMMSQGEGVLFDGADSQTASQRWGDYTSMVVDPVDDCTFWYTNQYLPVPGNGTNWYLGIGAFKFETCTAPEISVDLLQIGLVGQTNTVLTQTLTISNTGLQTLTWTLFEENPVSITNLAVPSAFEPSDPADNVGRAPDTLPAGEAPAVPAGWSWPTEFVLVDNGPLETCPNCGFGGARASELDDELGMNTYGFGIQASANNWIADDFTVADAGGWQIETATLFAYQTNSSTSSTITGLNWLVYEGSLGGAPVAGGSALEATGWTGMYRSQTSNPTANNRPIMYLQVDLGGLYLPPGTYWLVWQASGTDALSGPWAPPITIPDELITGNGEQSLGGTRNFQPLQDTGTLTQQGVPFILQGTVREVPCLVPGDVPWLSVNKAAGSIAPAASDALTVTLDTTGLSNGVYEANLCINTNDPDESIVSVPVSLIVSENWIYLPAILR